jgi:hypothetical protein
MSARKSLHQVRTELETPESFRGEAQAVARTQVSRQAAEYTGEGREFPLNPEA